MCHGDILCVLIFKPIVSALLITNVGYPLIEQPDPRLIFSSGLFGTLFVTYA